jgi:rhodanese-related sulfurtransferase
MIEAIKKLLGIKTTNYSQLMEEGAIIIDVRSAGEFSYGHINGSINIPVDKLVHKIARLKSMSKPIITCCASGMRSASAKSILQSHGFTNVYNGGAWHRLNMKINN